MPFLIIISIIKTFDHFDIIRYTIAVKNKRLIACLLVLIFVAGFAVSSALIFRIQEINLLWANTPAREIIPNKDAAIARYTREAKDVAGGKNIFTGINRKKIAAAIEASDPLVRVDASSIEAKFPNKLEIRVQARYPMYYVQQSGLTAIMDYEFQIISHEPSMIEQFNLIDLNEQFDLVSEFTSFELGQNLREFIVDKTRVDTLVLMSRLFFGGATFSVGNQKLELGKYSEERLCHLIQAIGFNAQDIQHGSMMLFLANERNEIIRVEIREYKEFFEQKLLKAWYTYQFRTGFQPGLIIVDSDTEMTTLWLKDGVTP